MFVFESFCLFLNKYVGFYRKVGRQEEEQIFLAELPEVTERAPTTAFKRYVGGQRSSLRIKYCQLWTFFMKRSLKEWKHTISRHSWLLMQIMQHHSEVYNCRENYLVLENMFCLSFGVHH